MISMNALMVHTFALLKQRVIILKVPMPVLAIQDTLETDLNAKSCPRKEQRDHHALKITVPVVLMVFVLKMYVNAFLGMKVALVLVPILMNAMVDRVLVHLMLHVETQLDPTPAHAEPAIPGMEELAPSMI